MRRTISRLAIAMMIGVSGVPLASPATASPASASAVGGSCTLTVARLQRLALYIHASATLHCKANVPVSSILLDLYHERFFAGRSVMRKSYIVPPKVNQSFGLLYACPGGTGGTNHTWGLNAVAFIKFPLSAGGLTRVGFTHYDTVGPTATFRC
jgi:hypothetical protein